MSIVFFLHNTYYLPTDFRYLIFTPKTFCHQFKIFFPFSLHSAYFAVNFIVHLNQIHPSRQKKGGKRRKRQLLDNKNKILQQFLSKQLMSKLIRQKYKKIKRDIL